MRPTLAPFAPSLLLLALSACEAPASVTPRSPGPETFAEPDKRSLYADAGLLPTREGERARSELALAGEIHAGLELIGLGPAHVDVELRGSKPRAVVVARVDPDAELAELEDQVAELAAASVPDLDRAAVHVWLHPRAESGEPRRERAPWALALACLGLGLSLGVTLERARGRRARPAP